jgi:hypothetical protein
VSAQSDDAVFNAKFVWLGDLQTLLDQWGIVIVIRCYVDDCGLPALVNDASGGDGEKGLVHGECPAGHELTGGRAEMLFALRRLYS